ncbi:Gluconolactonase, partial [Pseudolycoriella hygida]
TSPIVLRVTHTKKLYSLDRLSLIKLQREHRSCTMENTKKLIVGIFIAINMVPLPCLCCDLMEDTRASCWDLSSTPYITYEQSKFGPLIEGASANPAGNIFAADYGNSRTTFQLGQGTIFTSGMKWLADTNNTHGDIWSCRRDGTVQQLEVLGRTNGIDLSPDEKLLYVSESFNRGGSPYAQRIWKYAVDTEGGTIAQKTLFADFDNLDGSVTSDIDGMKTDTMGNLFVARYGGRHVAVLSPTGTIIGKIRVSFPNPTNLEFGGQDGKTLFIVGQCSREGRGCVDQIRVVNPGRTWKMLQ